MNNTSQQNKMKKVDFSKCAGFHNDTTTGQSVFDTKPATGEGNAPRKAIVRQSHDKQWPKWAVIYPDRRTQWFDSESTALLASDDYNGNHYL